MNPILTAIRADIAQFIGDGTWYATTDQKADAIMALVEKRLGPVLVAARDVVNHTKAHNGIASVDETHMYQLERSMFDASTAP